jgi:opacity protein-like surface antigen
VGLFKKEMNMLRKGFLLVAVVLLVTIGSAVAAEPPTPGGFLHGDIGYTYNTLEVWRGYLTYGHHSSSHLFINTNFGDTGFGLDVQTQRANASGSNPDGLGYNNEQRWDYTLRYSNVLEADQTLETRYIVGYRYFNFPEMSSHTRFSSPSEPGSIDLQEVFAGFSFPKLFGIKGLVPSYVLIKGWPSNSNTLVGARNPNGGTYSGFAHVFMLDYALPTKGFITDEQTFNFHMETVYNGAVDPRPGGGYTDHDWTHVLLGVSTDFDLGHDLTFTPGVYHQITMEDDPVKGVNPDHNMTWASLTVKYKF